MRGPFVISTGVLALALVPAALAAQTPTAQPPAQQPTAQQPAEQPAAAQAETKKPEEPPKVTFTSPAGMLFAQIKPDQTATFEEMIGKLKAGLASTQDPKLQQQAAGLKVYKAGEQSGNALYVVFAEPALPNTEYELFGMLHKTMTEEQLRDPAMADVWKRYADAFAAGLNKLSLTPIGGGM